MLALLSPAACEFNFCPRISDMFHVSTLYYRGNVRQRGSGAVGLLDHAGSHDLGVVPQLA